METTLSTSGVVKSKLERLSPLEPTPKNRIQGQLLRLAALFLGLYCLAITLAPAARARSWQVEYPLLHWASLGLWTGIFWLAHRNSARLLPDRDPFLLPLAGLLSGWGILTITRLNQGLGLRQSIWLLIGAGIFTLGLKLPRDLGFLKRYKYLWLTGGLALTALTLVMGTNPLGYGPRMWLGCCGFYMQPSEPLKLLLVIFLSAYLADRQLSLLPLAIKGKSAALRSAWFLLPMLAPTLVMTGIATLLLLAQRDLGTATIFLFLYTTIVFIATGMIRFIWPSLATLGVAGVAGYILFDVVRLRIDAWINPWIDPSGRSYQIVQSLLAVANGGLFGRGPGMGNPTLVPVSHSDFIFVAIIEETGLAGAAILIGVLALLVNRGLRIALQTSNAFHRYLAAGLTTHLVGQSILIIGGNLRLLPLTGVTLPFVSYGGSSLLTSFISLLILELISNQTAMKPASWSRSAPFLSLSAFLSTGLAATLLITGWWSMVRASALLARTDNARRGIADRYVPRGIIRDRNNLPLAENSGNAGDLSRLVVDAGLGSVLGYNHPVYGQSGLEASLDPYLRGTLGNSATTIWWANLLYGQPPPGLDVRLSLDLALQRKANDLLAGHRGALVLINAETGEILAMVSHPTFDPNRLDQDWPALINDSAAPLLNRATQGQYPVGAAASPLLLAAAYQTGTLPDAPPHTPSTLTDVKWDCTAPPHDTGDWGQLVKLGCPGAVEALGVRIGIERLYEVFSAAGFFTAPQVGLPAETIQDPKAIIDAQRASLGLSNFSPQPDQALLVSPLQMALAAASLSNGGNRPTPRLILSIDQPKTGWVIWPIQENNQTIVPASAAQSAQQALSDPSEQVWYSVSNTISKGAETEPHYSWFVGGSSSAWQGSPLALAVILEEDSSELAQKIGLDLLNDILRP